MEEEIITPYPLELLEVSFLNNRLERYNQNKKYPDEYYILRKQYHALKKSGQTKYSYKTYDFKHVEVVGRHNNGFVITNNFDGNRFVIYFGTTYPSVEQIRINNELAMKGIRTFIYEVGMVMNPSFYNLSKEERKIFANKQQYQERDEEGKKIWYWVTDYFIQDMMIDKLCKYSAYYLDGVYEMFTNILNTIHKNNYIIPKFEMKQMFIGYCDNYENKDNRTIFCMCPFVRWFNYPYENYNNKTKKISYPNPDFRNVKDYIMNNIVKVDFSRYNSVRTDESGFVEPIDNWMSVMFIMLDIMGMFIPDCIIYDNDYSASMFKIGSKNMTYEEAKNDFDMSYRGTEDMYKYYLNKYLNETELPTNNIDNNIPSDKLEKIFIKRIDRKIGLMKRWKKNFVKYINWMLINYDENITVSDIKENVKDLVLYMRNEDNIFEVDGVQWNYYNLFVICIGYLSMINQFKRNYIDNEFISSSVYELIRFFTKVYTAWLGYENEEWMESLVNLNPDVEIPVEEYREFADFFVTNELNYNEIVFNAYTVDEWNSYDRLVKYTCMNDYKYPVVKDSYKLQSIMDNVTGKKIQRYEFESENPNEYLERMNRLAAKIANQENDDADPRYYHVNERYIDNNIKKWINNF